MSSDNNKVYGAATAVMAVQKTYFKEVTSGANVAYEHRSPTFAYDDLVAGTLTLTNETASTLTNNSNTSAYTLSYAGDSANAVLNGQFVFTEFTLGYKVPARTEYVVTYKFDISMQRQNSAVQQGATVELFMFGETGSQNCGSLSGNSLSFTAYTTSPYAVAGGDGTGNKVISTSYTATVTYSNRSDSDTTMTTSFAFKAGNTATPSTTKTYWKYCTCTATPNVSQINDLWLEAPANVATDYTGTQYTDSNLNTISSITSASWYDPTKMTLSLQGGTAQDAGDYYIDVALVNTATTDDPWKLSNGTFTHATQTIKFTINKVTPTVSFGNASTTNQYTAKGTQDEFPKATVTYNNNAVPGTLSWGSQTPEGSTSGTRKNYNYTFTPDNTTNYNTCTGSISLNYITATIDTITVTIKDPSLTVYASTDKTTLVEDYFTVMVKYKGIAEPDEVKSYEIIGWKAGTNVAVNIMVGSAMSDDVIIPLIGIDKIESLTAVFTQGSNKITPDTTGDELKPMLTVIAKWNYANETKPLAAVDYKVEFTPVVGTDTSTVVVKFINSDKTEVSATARGTITVVQEELDTSGVSVTTSTSGVKGSNGVYSCTYDP
ncbi:MAG: hypothetical protein K2G26_05895, partial [Clostridia bacterium]|nr:hypothetical protein [Clostridia bacterium]